MHLHRADIPQALLPPDLPVKLVCGKEGVGMPDEEGQDAVLHVGQMDAPAILFHAMAVGIQRKGRTVVAADAGLCGGSALFGSERQKCCCWQADP